MLKDQLTPQLVNQMSKEVGGTPQQTQTAAEGIFSTLLGGLSKNAQSESGALGILSALDRDHDGSILDDVMGMLMGGGNAQTAAPSALNGAGIVGHILGGQQNGAVDMIAKMTGLDKSGVGSMMLKLAPLVMGALGKAKQEQGGGLDVSSLASMLGGSVQQGNASSPMMQMATKFLDRDGDGDVMDDVMEMGQSLLGSFFKKR